MNTKTDRQKLYGTLKNNKVTVKVPYNPLLLSLLGQYNCLRDEDKPLLTEVERLKKLLISEFGLNL